MRCDTEYLGLRASDLLLRDDMVHLAVSPRVSAKLSRRLALRLCGQVALYIRNSEFIDNNEASWTQVLEVEFGWDASHLPILLDGDTGFGNFNNAVRLVRKLESRGVAGVGIEDKVFPKNNSLLLNGASQVLAPVDEMCGKIRAMKDAQTDPDFCVVARGESLIAGLGGQEMRRRCEAYALAGADAILCHSKRSDASESEISSVPGACRSL